MRFVCFFVNPKKYISKSHHRWSKHQSYCEIRNRGDREYRVSCWIKAAFVNWVWCGEEWIRRDIKVSRKINTKFQWKYSSASNVSSGVLLYAHENYSFVALSLFPRVMMWWIHKKEIPSWQAKSGKRKLLT